MGILKYNLSCEKEIDSVCFASSIINLSHFLANTESNVVRTCLIVISENTAKCIKLNNLFNYVVIANSYKIKVKDRVLYRIGVYDDTLKMLSGHIRRAGVIYGTDHGAFYFMYRNKNKIVFEDGAANYSINNKNIIKKIWSYVLGDNPAPYGKGYKVMKLYLTKPNNCKLNENKIDIKLSLEKAMSICSIPMPDMGETKGFGILLTQPLSEDGILSEPEKLSIYREIMLKEGLTYLKPHPRESSDYSDLGEVIPGEIPVELLLLSENRPGKIVTLFSTAADYCSLVDQSIEIKKYGSFGNVKIEKAFYLKT
ncbi:glycosyltransferase family 52 protein [Enterovibrio sp. ZSDZ42]|uniref:Glycosyltransferase family 52 protein n=1 Tax=Enterovibrio gelatinilyticus TaxID=2899819 RepID=A0ABT5R6Z1_9GAMM|nr:glycosyltransferase family 52 [Enterovibrio sp. ZSDZ42]MDD1796037.1 glycosyltransferase family 52 protein [Enterovibrio sp. ZSDZ42]